MAGKLKLQGDVLIKAKKMLKDVCEILESSNISYILEAGTLLGIVRENRLLPWDNDIDITITDKNKKKLLWARWKFWLKGYRFYVRHYKRDAGPFKKGELRIVKIQTRRFIFVKDLGLLDIFIKRPIKHDYYWTIGVKKPVLKSVPKKFYDELNQIEFEGKKYSVPKDYKDYLKYFYGDWETPKKDYNCRTDDKCMIKVIE
ncbi:MAG: LicD family protein [Patescibacteria group bacterium]|nr:LicD family protein [Patescibacteria group bacterium]MEA3499535.1 LicD family protein [Candidatus Neomarinimicrobiota bacterium]